MKRRYKVVTMILFALFLSTGNVYAMDKHDHGKEHGKEMEGVDHSAHAGENIHNSQKDGYALAYHLIDIKAQMATMKNNPQAHDSGMMEMTHHLMVYLTDADGHPMKEAKVGYLVVNPDGTKQKLMSMHMKGGFGSDINLTQKGTYTIKTKVLSGDTKIMDQFSYEVN
ncbi:MAG: hypothetical protein QNJ04_15915 [Desulfobacterales bacterium]|nr:hypothetical protein [Desulfobacterales bacterium]